MLKGTGVGGGVHCWGIWDRVSGVGAGGGLLGGAVVVEGRMGHTDSHNVR